MKYYIFLDDIRHPQYVARVPGVPKDIEWSIARSFEEFVEILESHETLPEFISYDHDLCMDAVRECIRGEGTNTFNYYRKPMKPTGIECVKYMINKCKEFNLPHPKYFIHSANRVGSDNMKKLIEQYNETVK